MASPPDVRAGNVPPRIAKCAAPRLAGPCRAEGSNAAVGHGEEPLPHGKRRKNVIDQICRRFCHPSGVAGGAHATTFAGVRDQEIVLTLVAVGASKSMPTNAAFAISAECLFDIGWWRFTVLAAGEFQPGFEVGLERCLTTRNCPAFFPPAGSE